MQVYIVLVANDDVAIATKSAELTAAGYTILDITRDANSITYDRVAAGKGSEFDVHMTVIYAKK